MDAPDAGDAEVGADADVDAADASDADTDAADAGDADTDAGPPARILRIPLGTLAFVSSHMCPVGWSEVDDVDGRAVVGVTDAADVGARVGAGSAFGVSFHTHDYRASFHIDGAGVAGASACCNRTPGQSGSRDIDGATLNGETLLPLVAADLCRRDRDLRDAEDHPFPDGTILHFDRDRCPEGWSPAEEAAGRLFLGTQATGTSGQLVGTALAPREERSHVHAMTPTVTLPSLSLVAGSGGNDDPARRGTYDAPTATDPTLTVPPYVHYLVCRADARPDPAPDAIGDTVPPQTVAWFEREACRPGWIASAPHRGRFTVIRDTTHGVGFIGPAAPLAPGEDRTHVHTFFGTVVIPQQSVALGGGCCFDRAAPHGTFSYFGDTAPASTGAPYVTYLACTPG